MAVTDWIDEITRLFEISDGAGGTVRSYAVFEKAEWPEALSVYPCALSYIVDAEMMYSLGGPCIDRYNGVTEFHLTPNTAKSAYPAIMQYFARIRNAAASSITLGGRVAHFLLRTGTGPSITGPVHLQYGGEEPHLGLLVYWQVKESVSGDFVAAA